MRDSEIEDQCSYWMRRQLGIDEATTLFLHWVDRMRYNPQPLGFYKEIKGLDRNIGQHTNLAALFQILTGQGVLVSSTDRKVFPGENFDVAYTIPHKPTWGEW